MKEDELVFLLGGLLSQIQHKEAMILANTQRTKAIGKHYKEADLYCKGLIERSWIQYNYEILELQVFVFNVITRGKIFSESYIKQFIEESTKLLHLEKLPRRAITQKFLVNCSSMLHSCRMMHFYEAIALMKKQVHSRTALEKLQNRTREHFSLAKQGR